MVETFTKCVFPFIFSLKDWVTYLVFMKAGKDLGALRDRLAREGLLENASLAANCGMEGEVLCPRLSELEEETGYFSLVVVKRGEK